MDSDFQRSKITHQVKVREGLVVSVVLDDILETFEGDEKQVSSHGVFPGTPSHELALKLLRPGWRVLDLGAHLGALSLPAAALGCEVLAVDACPRSARRLQASAASNGFDNMRVLHAAADDRRAPLEFFPHGAWGHVKQDSERVTTASIEILGITVDEMLREIDWRSVDLVKLSLTGYEVQAIAGMGDLLSAPEAPIILLRSNGHALHWYHQNPRSLRSALVHHGYRFFLITGSPTRTLIPVQAGDIQFDCIVDYLAIKDTRQEPKVDTWTYSPSLTNGEMEQRVLAACDQIDLNYQAYIGRELQYAPDFILSSALVQERLKQFRNSAYSKVSDAAGWSGSADNLGHGVSVNGAVPPEQIRYCTVNVKPAVEVIFAVDSRFNDPIGRYIATQGFPLEPPIELMIRLLRPGNRVFDFGGHIGTYALTAAALGCEVVAVEGSEHNVSLLRAAAVCNEFDKLRIFHAAVTNKAGIVTFFSQYAWGTILSSDGDRTGTVSVAAITGDGLLEDVGWDRVDFIKMDIEGAELLAIKGMPHLLGRPDAPVILFESNAKTLLEFGETPSGLLRALESFGYSTHYIDRLNDNRFAKLSSNDLQPDCIADFIAFKSLPESLKTSHLDPLTREELTARLLSHASSHEWPNRWYAASIFRDAPRWLSENPLIKQAAETLSRDPRQEVREIAKNRVL